MSAKYWLPCPCGRKTAVSAVQAGQTVRCECGRALEAPAFRAIALLEPVEEAADSGRTGGLHVGHLLVVSGLVLLVIGLGLAGWRATRHTQAPQMIDYPPVMVWMAWQELRLGVDRGLAPDQMVYQQELRQQARLGLAALILAIAGAMDFALGLILLYRRRKT